MKSYTYVMADIHGQYDSFVKMLKKIKFNDNDTLYIIGDVLDRGPEPIKTLLHIMNSKNMVMLAGNHEYMATLCLNFLLKDITEEFANSISETMMEMLSGWRINGGSPTIKELFSCDRITRNNIFSFLSRLKLYKEITVNDKTFLLVHAGLGGFKKNKKLKEYNIMQLTSERLNYNKQYFKDKYLVTGHTPTQIIEDNPNPGYIYFNKNNIAIDCGCTFGERLGCLRLDDFKEYYVENKK